MNQSIYLSVRRITGFRINTEDDSTGSIRILLVLDERQEERIQLRSAAAIRDFLQPKIPMEDFQHYLVGDEVWSHCSMYHVRFLLGSDLAAILAATLRPLAAPEVA